MKRTIFVNIALIIFFSISLSKVAFSWNDGITHKDLSKYASENSVLNKGYLEHMGFNKGLDDEKLAWNVKKLSIKEWLAEGAKLEDSPMTRSLNHFHNPMKPWELAGLNDMFTGQSSLLWSQDGVSQQDKMKEDWSWKNTRDNYYAALLSGSEIDRQAKFAQMFTGLGHQIHLLQDTGVPDHVRNDAHPEDAIFGSLNINIYFESWVKANLPSLADMKTFAPTPVYPNISLNPSDYSNLDPSFQSRGLSPSALFFDTDTYDGLNASAGINQGLSEYTNANFFSGDTIFAAEMFASHTTHEHYFPFPRRASTDLQDFINGTKHEETITASDGTQDTGVWISKIGDGEQIAHFAKPGLYTKLIYSLIGEGNDYYSSFYRDKNCHHDYAKALIPRAVGYSAGLINYFFRGNIEISLPSKGVYSLIDSSQTGFTNIKLLAKNTTENNEEMTDGSIELVLKYKLAQEDPFQSNPVATSPEFIYRVIPEANNIRFISRNVPVQLSFDLSGSNAIPLWATDLYLQIVYHGKLGNEDGAVAVGFKDISEPTPVDIYNNRDKICLNESWYNAGSPEAIAQAPFWDIYPHDMGNILIKISSLTDPQNASPTNFDNQVPLLTAGNLKRSIYILGDYQDNPADYKFNFSIYKETIPIDPEDSSSHSDVPTIFTGNTIKNQTDYNVRSQAECDKVEATAPCDVRYSPLFYSFRGINMWGPAGVIFDNPKYPEDTSCSWSDL